MFDDPFKAGLLTSFIIAAVAGLAVFSANPGLFGGGESKPAITVDIWGTVKSSNFSDSIRDTSIPGDDKLTINYDYVRPERISEKLINSLARGNSPDALLYSNNRLLELDEFIQPVTANWYTPRRFRNNFLEVAEVYSQPRGILALPFAMDPLVMYWNRDILTESGFVSPPSTWSEMDEYVGKIAKVDDSGNIGQAAVAMGLDRNITHSKELLSALLFQGGNGIVRKNDSTYTSLIAEKPRLTNKSESAVRLYTQFADPGLDLYTWNSTFSADKNVFTANQVGMYFAPGSEVQSVREENPNLNFDVSTLPQRDNAASATYASVYGLSIVRGMSRQRQARVLSAMQRLTSQTVAESIVNNTNLTPTRKKIIANYSPSEPYKSTFMEAAVNAQTWPDPDPKQSDPIFSDLISDVSSGQLEISDAVEVAHGSLNRLYQKISD